MSNPHRVQDTLRAFDDECTLCSYRNADVSNAEQVQNIDLLGDVVLQFLNSDAGLDFRYRCSRVLLRHASAYFEVLLDPTKFQEGREVQCKLNELSKTYPGVASFPVETLPVVMIQDIGDVPAHGSHRQAALGLFLKIIQKTTESQIEIDEWATNSAHPLSIITLLAIIADRFEAHGKVANCIKRMDQKLFEDGKRNRGHQRQTEINRRKRLLVGMLLGFPEWVRRSSASLICEGSDNWTRPILPPDAEEPESSHKPLWWRLPDGMEEELQSRREYILETISSLPSHFIGLYTGKQLQCKLGYDTSPACDCFQLGQMIRFFTRKGLLSTQSTYVPSEEPSVYAGEVTDIMEKLRQCPSYQLDSNHHHCGLRTRLLPLMDALWPNGQVGICLKCWTSKRDAESWLESPTRGVWILPKVRISWWNTCLQHTQLKGMYTAEERDWTPPPF